MVRSVLFFILLLMSVLLGGCTTPRVDLALAIQPNVNPDHTGRPSPVIIKVYELRSDLAFKQSDFYPLFENPVQVLGADLLAADELVVVPGEARRVIYEPATETRFMGIMAGFRQMERGQWKVVSSVNPETKNAVSIEVNDATLILIPREKASDWDPEQAVRNFQQSGTSESGLGGEESDAAPVKPKTNSPETKPREMGYVMPTPKRIN
jgi:type VI secretion system protein VasD